MPSAIAGPRYKPPLTRHLLAALILFALGFATMDGWVVVFDPGGAVERVVQSNANGTIALTRLPGGIHVGTALEGEPLLLCRDGSVSSLGYVTTIDHVWKQVKTRDCRGGSLDRPRYIGAPN